MSVDLTEYVPTREELDAIAEYLGTTISVEAINQPIEEDEDARDWMPTWQQKNEEVDEKERKDSVKKIRRLVRRQPNCRRALGLYESYVFGAGFGVNTLKEDPEERPTSSEKKVIRKANTLWTDFLRHNRKWWTPLEFGTRTWRDGNQYTKKMPNPGKVWPPEVRFLDDEEIDDPGHSDPGDPYSFGVIVSPYDSARIMGFNRIDVKTQERIEVIPAEMMFYTKIDVDANIKKGISRFFSVQWSGKKIADWLMNELTHRMAQSSIVLQRKMKGSPNQVSSLLNNLKTGTTDFPERSGTRRETLRRGTIVTTNEASEWVFTQPDSNFADSSPLGKWLVLQIASATGWPYYMVSSDSSDTNLASSIVQESPVVKMVEQEQAYFHDEFLEIWQWVMEQAIRAGKLKIDRDTFFEEFRADIRFPSLVTRDRLKERQADNLGVMNGSLSKAEYGRRDGVDPERMANEVEDETERGLMGPQGDMSAMNPTVQDKQAGQGGNTTGTNQGDDGSQIHGHKDRAV